MGNNAYKDQNLKTDRSWEDQIAINKPKKAFCTLSSVSNFLPDFSNNNPESSQLESSLENYMSNDNFRLPSTEDREEYHGDRHFD